VAQIFAFSSMGLAASALTVMTAKIKGAMVALTASSIGIG
jgi:hypothetical protein